MTMEHHHIRPAIQLVAVADQPKFAPAGWHVANDDEWTYLTNDLGG